MEPSLGYSAIVRDRSNPLARVARRICTSNGHPAPDQHGAVACLSCWGEAIRRDERVRVEEDLPAAHGDDTTLVDEVAVARFVAGEAGRPRLNWAEKAEAAKQLLDAGVSRIKVQQRLGVSPQVWRRLTAVIYAGAPVSSMS